MKLTDHVPAAPGPQDFDTAVPDTPTAQAADEMAAAASGLQQAQTLLRPGALSELLGQQVQITHIRSKPGRSLLVAHSDLEGSTGWTMLSVDPVKYHNAQERAQRFNTRLQVHSAAGPYLFSGSVWGDPHLSKELAGARQALGPEVGWKILRYNPRRRVVAAVRTGSSQKVIRVHAGRADHLWRTARRWRAAGLPVSNLYPLGGRHSAVISPLWGDDDLSRSPHVPAAETAGSAVADLHRLPPPPPHAELVAAPSTAAAGLAQIAPWAGPRAENLAQRLQHRLAALPAAPAVELHGDLSPDQVVTAAPASHKIRIIDLDRAGCGDPMRDVGSWIAACRRDQQVELIDAFLAGYSARRCLEPAALNVWEAYAHLSGAADFFRHRNPDWPALTIRALNLSEEALNR